MSLQTIVDNATFVTIYRKKIAGQSISRSGRLLTSEVVSAVPYQFTVGMHGGLQYSTNRALTESLNFGLGYITAYLGVLTSGQQLQVTVTSASASSLVLNTTAVTGSPSGLMFKKGDYVQPAGGYRYPYQVTADVTYNGTSVTVPLSRNFIPQDSYTLAGQLIVTGSAVTWKVKMINKPRYSVVPGDLLQFDNDFEFIEFIRKEDA